MADKQIFPESLGRELVEQLRVAPDSQMSEAVRRRMVEYFSVPRTPEETFDYLDGISREPITEVSRFVKGACSLSRCYIRPN